MLPFCRPFGFFFTVNQFYKWLSYRQQEFLAATLATVIDFMISPKARHLGDRFQFLFVDFFTTYSTQVIEISAKSVYN